MDRNSFGVAMKPASDDLDNRRPVWDALSELFLDVELLPDDFQRLGKNLSASPYAINEFEKILYGEVYPVCIWNLLDIAGVWQGFDTDSLQEAILNHNRSWLKIPRFVRVGRWMIRKEWSKTKEVIHEHRNGASSAHVTSCSREL